MRTTAEKLEAKRAELAALEARFSKASRSAVNATPGGGSSDPGILSGISRKPNPKKDAARWNAYSREAEAGEALRRCKDDVAILENRIKREVRDAPMPYLTEELKAAKLVRTDLGWHKVVKVNAKSVSVETGYSWTDRYTLDKILEVRA